MTAGWLMVLVLGGAGLLTAVILLTAFAVLELAVRHGDDREGEDDEP